MNEDEIARLNWLVNDMKAMMDRFDLPDDYLKVHFFTTRDETGISENIYGITKVPCQWVYPYLVKLQELLKKENSNE